MQAANEIKNTAKNTWLKTPETGHVNALVGDLTKPFEAEAQKFSPKSVKSQSLPYQKAGVLGENTVIENTVKN
jgi:hypothetical protein